MKKKFTGIKLLKLFVGCFLGALLGSFLFQYFSYGIQVNSSIKDIENIKSITINQENQRIDITDKEEISEAVLFTDFLYMKIGQTEDFIPTTEYIVKLKSGEKIEIGSDDKHISKNGKQFNGNEEYLKVFNDSVKNIVLN